MRGVYEAAEVYHYGFDFRKMPGILRRHLMIPNLSIVRCASCDDEQRKSSELS